MNVNMRSMVLIGIALVVAGITAFLAKSLISSPQPQNNNDQQAVAPIPASNMKILVAAANLQVGHFIKEEDLSWQSWPDEAVNDNYIQQKGEATKASLLGAVVNSSISAGEPILENRLVKPGNRGFMAAVLPAGKRAISIRITATRGNAGFIFPGDLVDILLTHQVAISSNNRAEARVSETVLKNIRILAINQRTGNPEHIPSIGQTATLEVTPKEAEKISLVKNMGELTLILRSLGKEENDPGQMAARDPRTLTWDSEVSSQLSAGSGAASGGKNYSVRVFRGGQDSEIFDFNKLFTQALAAQKNPQNNQPGEKETEE